MKYQEAWKQRTKDAFTARALAWGLGGLSVLLVGMVCVQAGKRPVVIERACSTRVLKSASVAVTDQERDVFVREVLKQRFDSDVAPSASFLSSDELILREREEAELKNRNMSSRVLVNAVRSLDEGRVEVDADRLISVGSIRSAYQFPLVLEIGSTFFRSEDNPYGLILVRAQPQKIDTDPRKPGAGKSDGASR